MRILVIRPKSPPSIHGLSEGLRWWQIDALEAPRQAAVLAAMTPKGASCTIADMQAGDAIPYDEKIDLAVVLADVDQVPGLRYVYGRFRAAGIPVATAGTMATHFPAQVNFADTVIEGHPEAAWDRLIALAEAGKALPSRLKAKPGFTFADLPAPDWSGVDLHRYRLAAVEVARAAEPWLPWEAIEKERTLEYQDPGRVVAELGTLARLGVRRAFLEAPDFLNDPSAAGDILDAIADWNDATGPRLRLECRCHPGHVTGSVAEQLSRSGIVKVHLVPGDSGAKTVGPETPEVATLLRRNGVRVQGHAWLGAENPGRDLEGAIERAARSLLLTSIATVKAIPGTPLYQQMKEAGRLLAGGKDLPYKRHVIDLPNVRPPGGDLEALRQQFVAALTEMVSTGTVLRRLEALMCEAEAAPAGVAWPMLPDVRALARMLLDAMDNPGEQRVRLAVQSLLALLSARPPGGVWTQTLDALLEEAAARSLVTRTVEGRKLDVERPPDRSFKERVLASATRVMGAFSKKSNAPG